MRVHSLYTAVVLSAVGATVATVAVAADVDVAKWLEPIREVGSEGQGHRAASEAWQQLAQASPEQLPAVLAGMDGAGPLARNWIRAAADSIAARQLDRGGKLPEEALLEFLADRRHSPHARVTAYEWIRRVDPDAPQRLLPNMLDDPAMELRHDAVAMAERKADQLRDAEQLDAARDAYQRAFDAARVLPQAKSLAAKLEKLGSSPSLAEHFGFIRRWQLVGPFDNRDTSGFDVAYGPEADPSLTAYPGKEGEVKWIEHRTDHPLGLVDLNQALGRHKGAIAYAYAEFVSDKARPCEIRLGCVTANKVWLNGQLVTANNVYHSGRLMDQYGGSGQLREGVNQILVKIAQNEQTDQWAQDWEFQLRVCDALGGGLLSSDR